MNTLLEQATPRPWHGEVDPIFGADGSVVLRIAAHKNAAENAALAIEAVNAYEPLVKALRELFDFVADGWGDDYPDAMRQAERALATVESSPEREGGE